MYNYRCLHLRMEDFNDRQDLNDRQWFILRRTIPVIYKTWVSQINERFLFLSYKIIYNCSVGIELKTTGVNFSTHYYTLYVKFPFTFLQILIILTEMFSLYSVDVYFLFLVHVVLGRYINMFYTLFLNFFSIAF